MKRQWEKYRNQNGTEGDCQLVTAVNVYYYLTGKTVDDKTYEKYIDLVGCRHGSAISIEEVWKKLGIKSIWEGNSPTSFEHDIVGFTKGLLGSKLDKMTEKQRDECFKKQGIIWKRKRNRMYQKLGLVRNRIPLPMEINVRHKKTGNHSALIVDHDSKCNAYRITNFRQITTHDGWYFAEDLYQFMGSAIGFSGCSKDQNRCRLFALKDTLKIRKYCLKNEINKRIY